MFSQTTVLNSSWSIRGTDAYATPIPVEPGQTLRADFGWLGAMRVRFVDEAGDPRNGSTPSQRVGERHVQGPL